MQRVAFFRFEDKNRRERKKRDKKHMEVAYFLITPEGSQ